MGLFKFMPEGSWWYSSESDPRWNINGRGYVGLGSMGVEAEEALERLKEQYGDPPEDLRGGYMKD